MEELTWADDNPFCLLLTLKDQVEPIVIDLGGANWATRHAEHMRTPGFWYLCNKRFETKLALVVNAGEQPYYVARHQGKAGSGGSNEITIYGIGKKRLDGHVDRMWVLPNGIVCGGDDDAVFGERIVEMMGPRGALTEEE